METTSPLEAEIVANAVKPEPSSEPLETPETSETKSDPKAESPPQLENIAVSRETSEPPAKKSKTDLNNTKKEPPLHEMVGGSSVRQYLNKHLTVHVLEGLKQISRDQPEDPLLELGQFLIQRSKELKEN
ncbi:hypothetical protein OXX69_005544 [Metschnikowia pulcherrima]